MERPRAAPRQQRRAKQRAAETPVERDARLRKERLKRAQKRSEETPTAREVRLVEERLKRARKRAEEPPAARAERLEKDRVRRARARAGRDEVARAALLEERRTGGGARRSGQRVEAGAVVSDAVQELGARALSCINFSADEIAFMGSSQRYTSDPRLALAYYYCCGVDPAGFVFGDEQLNGDEGSVPRERLEGIFDDYPKPDDLSACQGLSSESESESTDIWACASCGRMLLQNKHGDKVVFCALREMQRFVLDDAERVRLFAGCSEACVRKYRQVYFAGGEVYYLIPELVRDVESIPLCETCRGDPRKSAFSVASGHDYGRVGELPELTQIALDCIAPVRCFGMDISFTGKHSSGHSICFPSDGPSKVASVLPRVEPDCMPRVTFIGPEEEWRIQKRKFRALYSIPVDSVYEWLGALSEVNNVFQEEQIRIDDSGRRRRQLVDLENAIDDGVRVTDSGDVNAVCDLATSERFGSDIHVYRGNIGAQGDRSSELSQDVVVQQSAVLPAHTESPTVAHGIVDALLDAIPPQTQAVVDASPPVVPIKRGCSPMVEWHENAKMLAGVFPNLFLTGSGPLPLGPLPHALVDHFLHYWDGRFEKSTRLLALLFNQMQRHAAVRNAARVGATRGGTLKSFGKLASTPEFKEALQLAKDQPESSHAIKLNAVLLRLLSLVGGTVPFSPYERAATRPKLGAMRYKYGVGQHWVTLAPPEHDALLLHRVAQLRHLKDFNASSSPFARKACSFSDLPPDLQKSARARLRVSNEYPALAAQVFERKVRVFTQALLRCGDSSSTRISRNYVERKRGVYGRVAGFNAVIEPQVDDRLHLHAIVYGAAVTPALLTRAAACPALWPSVRRWLDAVSCTTISKESYAWRDEWLCDHDGRMPRAFDIPVPGVASDYVDFVTAAERRALSTNVHTHSLTCRKGLRGKFVCRLARPAGVYEQATRPLVVKLTAASHLGKRKRAEFVVGEVLGAAGSIDAPMDYSNKRLLREHTKGAVVWEQYRAPMDDLFVETNLSLACFTKSHTNSAIINGTAAGDMVEEYQHAYMTKEKGGLKSSAAVMLTAIRDVEKYPSTADDSGTLERQAKYLATRTVNALTGATEWPHQLMAYALAGYRSYLSSDTFWYLFPRELASYIEDDRDAAVSGVNLDEEREVKDSSGDGEELQEGRDVSSIQRRLEKLVSASADECRVEAAPGGPLRKTGAKMYTVNKEVIFVSQAESYRHRGKHFAEYSPLEFEMIVDVLPRQEAGAELPSTRRGRPKRRGFDLSPSHPLSPRFQGCVRAKFRTPMLGGAPLPSLRKDGDPPDVLGKYLVCLMSEWTLDNGRPSYALNGDGLFNLCANWNRSGVSFIDRGRYRVLENILQKGYRSSRNEKACSEWRSRNADFWVDVAVDSSRSSRPTEHAPSDYGSDTEASGSLTPEELLELTVAAAAKDLKAVKTARVMRSTFWSLIPNGGACSRAIQTGDEDPIFSQAGDFPSLAHISKNVHAMLSPEHIYPDPSCPVGADTQGDSRPGHVSAGFADCAERMACSTDQREVFDRILGSVERNGKLRQTLTLLHGGGGTGKSRLMRMITLVLRQHGIDTVNTCPTGVGACHLLNGKTFHSAFKTFRKGNLSPNDLELLRLTFTEKVALIVIDEASMFCAEFLVLLDQRLRAIYNSDQVFGGRSILLVGDFLQLEVITGTPLCKVLYLTTASDVLLSARVLFRLFSVFFLETQHRAAACTAQQSNLTTCRALPSFYPSGQRWADEDTASFRPMTDAVVNALTHELTAQDVANDQTWMDDLTILVTSNVDKAILTSCTARLFATRQKKTLFRWRRQLRQDLPTTLENVVYDEDANPELFAYFVVGAPANVLDNNSGNVGWGVANGTPCRLHSLA